MKLEEFIPETPVFTLSSTGKSYELKIPNLEDKVAMVRLAGGEEHVSRIFKERDWSAICKLIYRLLIDKSDFIAKKEKRISDEGIEEEVLVTGPVLLLRSISTQKEMMEVLKAFNAASVASEPLVKELMESEVKKNLLELSTGENSTISSPVNTDLPQNNSELLPTGS